MTDRNRELILGTVKAPLTENAPIVITHAADEMIETAMFLEHRIQALRIRIVATGAVVPLDFEGSAAAVKQDQRAYLPVVS